VDCWGQGDDGQLGNGTFDTSNPFNPVAVEGVGGVGTLSEVASLSDGNSGGTICAVLDSGGVDCWGNGQYGELGNGITYTSSDNYGSDVPVAVEGVGGAGSLSEVASLTPNGGSTYCALLVSGGVDCWGLGQDGVLGNGNSYTHSDGSNVPVAVEGVGVWAPFPG
jgi:alpha-tubulin suppressor-like RCC1 family protein